MFSAVAIGSQCANFTTMTRDGLGAVVCLKTQAVQIRDRHPTLEILVDQKRLLSAPVAYTQEIPDQPLDQTFYLSPFPMFLELCNPSAEKTASPFPHILVD